MTANQGYNPLSVLLHWFTVLWFLVMWTAGVLISQWSGAPDLVYDLHVTVGVCGAAVILFRVGNRLVKGFAPSNPAHASWERWLARLVQWVFLIALILAIATGLLRAFAGVSSQYFLWGAELPKLGRLGDAGDLVSSIHMLCSLTLLIAVVLHVAGALKHSLLQRDGTLMRILKPSSPGK